MKATVLIVLLTCVLASHQQVAEFFTGYAQGTQEPESCLSNPAKCGETLGQVMAFLGKQDLASYAGFTPAEVDAFFQGLISGLKLSETGVSTCETDFTQGNFQLQSLYSALKTLLSNYEDWSAYITFACSGVSITNYDFVQDCHFNTLWDNIRNLGFGVLLDRYLLNSCDINTAIVGLVHCGDRSLNWCGFNSGVIIRELLGWGI